MYHLITSLETLGLPEFSDASLPACHGLWTPADLHILAKTDASVLPFPLSAGLKPSASAIGISKLYQHFRVRDHPYDWPILRSRFIGTGFSAYA